MKNFIYSLAFVLILYLFSGIENCSAQWVQSICPFRGNVTCFTVSGTNYFAGSGGYGLYRSTDNGDNWAFANNGI